jgi:hypothetical protein
MALAGPGDVVSPPPRGSTFGRIAFAITVADSAPECLAALDAAESAITVRPAAPAAPAAPAGPARPVAEQRT